MAKEDKRLTAQLTQQFKTALDKQLNPRLLAQAAEAVGEEMVKIVLERTSQGIDTKGKRFKTRSAAYIRQKGKFIKRGYKTKKSKEAITGLAAVKANNWLRRTGKMLRAVYVRKAAAEQLRTGNVRLNVQLGMNDKDAEKIATYHIEGTPRMPKRSFFGLSDKSSGQYKKEQARLSAVLAKKLGLK